jgi:hypothetical protein
MDYFTGKYLVWAMALGGITRKWDGGLLRQGLRYSQCQYQYR